MNTVESITRTAGIAGQVAYTARVQYDDEPASAVTFVGSTYGGPVVMRTESGAEVFVTEPGRFGKFGPEWVRAFFGDHRA